MRQKPAKTDQKQTDHEITLGPLHHLLNRVIRVIVAQHPLDTPWRSSVHRWEPGPQDDRSNPARRRRVRQAMASESFEESGSRLFLGRGQRGTAGAHHVHAVLGVTRK